MKNKKLKVKSKKPKRRKKGSGGPRKGAGPPRKNKDNKMFGVWHSRNVIDAVNEHYGRPYVKTKARTFLDDLHAKIPPTLQKE